MASFFPQNTNRIKEIDRTLKCVTNSVLEIVKYDAKNETELRLKLAKLRKERLGVLALVARSQAVLAEMEVLIAENEIDHQLLDLKRKEPSCDSRKVMSLKKIKFSEVNDEGVTEEPPKVKTTSQCKIQDKFTNKNLSDKENYNPLPSASKQGKLMNNPPFKNSKKRNVTGYVTADRPMETKRQSHATTNNSIYEQAESTEYLLSGNPKPTSNLTQKGANNLNYNDPRIYLKKNYNKYNKCYKKGIQSIMFRRSEKPVLTSKENIQNKQCACDVVPNNNNITDTNCSNNKKNNGHISTSSSDIEASEENIKTTNDVFKDIMNNKVTLKQENDEQFFSFSSIDSIDTQHIEIPKSIEY